MIDAGAALPDEKVIHYQFPAENDEAAHKRANDFARGSETRKEFWLFDENPEIVVTAFLEGDEPTEERAWLAN